MAATRTYEVQEGDSLWHIARETDIDVPALCLANRIGDPSLIYRGQELLLPDTRTRRYVTKKGDTVADLSLKFAVPATELAAKNHVAQVCRTAQRRYRALPFVCSPTPSSRCYKLRDSELCVANGRVTCWVRASDW